MEGAGRRLAYAQEERPEDQMGGKDMTGIRSQGACP